MKEQTVGIASLGRVLNIGDRRIQQLVVDLGDIMPLPDRNFTVQRFAPCRPDQSQKGGEKKSGE